MEIIGGFRVQSGHVAETQRTAWTSALNGGNEVTCQDKFWLGGGRPSQFDSFKAAGGESMWLSAVRCEKNLWTGIIKASHLVHRGRTRGAPTT